MLPWWISFFWAAQALRLENYQVLEARNGAEALTMFDEARGQIDLLVTDIRMPFVRGSELAEELRTRKPGLRLLYVSGYPSEARLGPTAVVLEKPFVRADLLKAVREVLDQPQASG